MSNENYASVDPFDNGIDVQKEENGEVCFKGGTWHLDGADAPYFSVSTTDFNKKKTDKDEINNPSHYTKGIESIQIIDECNLSFCLGNAVKYIIRCEHKDNANGDLAKALWYIAHELEKRQGHDLITAFCERWLKHKTTMSKIYSYEEFK